MSGRGRGQEGDREARAWRLPPRPAAPARCTCGQGPGKGQGGHFILGVRSPGRSRGPGSSCGVTPAASLALFLEFLTPPPPHHLPQTRPVLVSCPLRSSPLSRDGRGAGSGEVRAQIRPFPRRFPAETSPSPFPEGELGRGLNPEPAAGTRSLSSWFYPSSGFPKFIKDQCLCGGAGGTLPSVWRAKSGVLGDCLSPLRTTVLPPVGRRGRARGDGARRGLRAQWASGREAGAAAVCSARRLGSACPGVCVAGCKGETVLVTELLEKEPGPGRPGTLGTEDAPVRRWKASQPCRHCRRPLLGLPTLDSALLPGPPGGPS